MKYLDAINPSATEKQQEQTVRDLIKRLISSRADEFIVRINTALTQSGKDTFQLVSVGNKISIIGNNGVAVAMGFYYYLSQFCHCHISWAGDQLHLPALLPQINTPLTIAANDRFRYYQNVCTTSYSFVWWDWKRWEREIDWMALNGFNLALAFNGMEAIWKRVYKTLGMSDKEIKGYFPGPAFLAWQRMGNMHGWGGPMSDDWHDQQLTLQHKILNRMRSFGMIPVLPSFAGHVPDAIKRLFPSANISHMDNWGNFDKQYCCNLLVDFRDPLFQKIGQLFLTNYIEEFGTDHVYSADTFNEMDPTSTNLSYLANAGRQVFKVMNDVDPQSVWLMQAWLFHSSFWTNERAKALLTSVPQGRLLVLDLNAELQPLYDQYNSFYGQPFIWCMLHNYGGVVSLYGIITSVNEGPSKARKYANSTMVGTGITMEGINQNYIMYHFMNENAWRSEPTDLSTWFSQYALSRYGKYSKEADSAWQILKDTAYNTSGGYWSSSYLVRRPHYDPLFKNLFATVYNCTVGLKDHARDVIPVRRPSFHHRLNPPVWYDPDKFLKAWDLMIKASDDLFSSSLFRYDLVDITREALQLISTVFYHNMIDNFQKRDYSAMTTNSSALLQLLQNMEQVLATNDQFLLGRWLESAKALGKQESDKKLFEFNARNQITLWGPKANILDYANKEWSGLMASYYIPRWSLFVYELEIAFKEDRKFDQDQFDDDVFRLVEEPFTYDRSIYPTTETGNAVSVCQSIHAYYRRQNNNFLPYLMSLFHETKAAASKVENDRFSKSYFFAKYR